MRLTVDKQARKNFPVARGVLDYFPLAIAEVALVSHIGNQQHNPGEPMHWAREKSTDHADCVVRHLIERGEIDNDGLRHSAKLAWRALALLQLELEDATAKVTLDKILTETNDSRPTYVGPKEDPRAYEGGNFEVHDFRPECGAAFRTARQPESKPDSLARTIYISGPMRGKHDLNFPAFDAAAAKFRKQGFKVINPADMDRADPVKNRPIIEYARRDLHALLGCTHIAMLPGWFASMGAAAEYYVAVWIGLEVLYV